MFKEMFTESDYNINENIFTKLMNKMKFAANSMGDKKLYYENKNKTLIAQINVLDYDTGEDYVKYERNDIVSGKKTIHESTLTEWYGDRQFSGGWVGREEDEQDKAFKFLQSVYNKDTKISLTHGAKYILDDIQKVATGNKSFTIAKQKINPKNNLIVFIGKTVNGEDISFDPTNIE